MNILYMSAAFLGLFTLVMYPVILMVDHLFFSHFYVYRCREWKNLATKLAIVELQMIESINQVRGRMGMQPIPAEAIVDQFKNVGPWSKIKDSIKGAIRSAIDQLGWVE